MLTTEPTSEMIAEWKRVFNVHRSVMKPNRKTGDEVDRYFRKKYPYQLFNDARFIEIAAQNITGNEFSRSKLANDEHPSIQSYQTGSVLVAIDICTGEFHIESVNVEEAMLVYDDLFVYRGLDDEDLKNYFLVAEYVRLTQD